MAIIIGILGGFFYGLIRLFRIYISHNILAMYFEDIVFWLLYAIVTFLTMLCINYGSIRPYILIAIAIGFIFYSLLIHNYVLMVLNPIIDIIRLLIEAVLLPIRLLLLPFQKILLILKKLLKKMAICEKIKPNFKKHLKR